MPEAFSNLPLLIAVVFGFYMAFNIGANDVANAMGTSVGSGALTLKKAIVVAAVFEFAGALLAGGQVTKTVGTGLLEMDAFTNAVDAYTYGMIAALLAAAAWLHLATHLGLPVSTTHSIVGAVWGFGLVYAGPEVVNWGKVAQVVMSWFVSPLAGAALAFALFRFVDRRIIDSASPAMALRRSTPVFMFLIAAVLTLSMIYKGLKRLHLDLELGPAFVIACVVGGGAALIGVVFTKRALDRRYGSVREEYGAVEGVFRYLQIMTACYVAFAHGANDVANAIGPLSSIVSVMETGTVGQQVAVPVWVLALGGIGIVSGLAILGYRVIATIGSRITEMTPSRGFSAEFGAATTVLICSKLGLPISTTHTLVGAVIGVGFARGFAALDLKVLRGILASWFITVPLVAVLTMVFYGITVVIIS